MFSFDQLEVGWDWTGRPDRSVKAVLFARIGLGGKSPAIAQCEHAHRDVLTAIRCGRKQLRAAVRR